jgi:hypothetical protein
VLINSTVDSGANKAPELTAAANNHGDIVNTTRPHRTTAAAAAATIAATASATTEPAGAGNLGSGSRSQASAVNADRSGPARAENRRIQPRTVDADRPNATATRRCPHPPAANTNAPPITATASARLTRQVTGNRMCVRPQPEHRARRGRNRHRTSPSPRTVRDRPYPHPTNRPPHPGHDNNPADSRLSTSARSLPTVTTGVSARQLALPNGSAKRRPGGPTPTWDVITLSSHTKKSNPHPNSPTPRSPRTTRTHHHVLTRNDAQQ